MERLPRSCAALAGNPAENGTPSIHSVLCHDRRNSCCSASLGAHQAGRRCAGGGAARCAHDRPRRPLARRATALGDRRSRSGTASYASQDGAAAFDTGRWAGLRTIHFGAGDASIQYRVLLGRRCRGGVALTIAVWRRNPTLLKVERQRHRTDGFAGSGATKRAACHALPE